MGWYTKRVSWLPTYKCGPIIQVTTYDVKGRIIKKEDWQKGKRCGPTKVYDNGILIKDIVYKNGLLESYVSYVAGKVNCQISADRKTIINQGKLVNIKWSKFYHVIDDRKFMFLIKVLCRCFQAIDVT
ncbi:MAG: hypothetical protein IPH98_06690 [Saprospiraceae bacterium]|nr:hypothetical protein [Candidatus Defluviibacterium haderslevense]